jgi:ABC-type Fe3+/spermidine/putrescine transport system ATPase subunit
MSNGSMEQEPRRIAQASGGDLVVTGVSKRYGGVPALTDVSLTIAAGWSVRTVRESQRWARSSRE